MSQAFVQEKWIARYYFDIQPDGTLIPNQRFDELYQKIEEKVFAEKNDNSLSKYNNAFLLYVGGAFCAGTTTLIKHLQMQKRIPPEDDPNTLYIRNSPIMAMIPELNNGWPQIMTPKDHFARDILQYERGGEEVTIMIQKRLGQEAARRKLTAVFDSHMSHEQQHLEIVDAYNQNKIPTINFMVFLDPEKYLERIKTRSCEEGRSVMFGVQLRAHQTLAELLCKMERNNLIKQDESNSEIFMANDNNRATEQCYMTSFDQTILLHNNIDAKEMAPEDRFGYQEFGRATKKDDGTVFLSIHQPDAYRLVRRISNLNAGVIPDRADPGALKGYFNFLKTTLEELPIGKIGHHSLKGFKSVDHYSPHSAPNIATDKLNRFVDLLNTKCQEPVTLAM